MLRAMIVGAATVLWLATAASAANYKVMIATWRGCEEACQGFQDYLKERGVDADIILRDAGQAKEALPGILAEARSEGVDLILSWGTSRSEEHTSELQSLMRISYAVFCLKKKIKRKVFRPQPMNIPIYYSITYV